MTGITDYHEDLSERELEILRLIADGLSNQEIADRLHLALTTVKWYNTQIYEKLDVKNRKQATRRAEVLGLFNVGTPPPAVERGKHNLPQDKTPFVGRSTELDELHTLIRQPEKRIITVLAPGGMGKTRLALEVARHSREDYTHGVFFVPLGPVNAAEYVATAIAESIGYPIQSNQLRTAAQQLLDYLEPRRMLLVLDNFEHLLASASLLGDVVQAAPRVTLLVTSRERLNLAAETVYTLGGMEFPTWTTLDEALEYDAVQLFMQGAHRARPDFDLRAADLPALARICRLTQGMPLGIELAAGWVDVLTLEQIADEIQQGIDFLETELRDVPARHRSIRATIDYSWQALDQRERDAFMRLSVFRGGFDAEAASTVAGAGLRVLRKLVNKALIYANADGRYDMHELLRQYSTDKLDATGFTDEVRDRHARYYAEFIASHHVHLMGMAPQSRVQIEPAYENIVHAWLHITRPEAPDFDLFSTMQNAFWQFLSNFGRNFDGVALFERARRNIESHIHSDDQRALYGNFLLHLAELYLGIQPQQGYAVLKQAIAVLEPLGPSLSLYSAYALHGNCYYENEYSDLDTAHTYLEKAAQVVEALDTPLARAHLMHLFGMVYVEREEYDQALAIGQDALALVQSVDPDDTLVESLNALLGQVYYAAGQYEKAKPYLLRALAVANRKAYLYWISGLRIHLWKVALQLGQDAEAREHVRALIEVHRFHGLDWQILGSLYGVAHHWHLHVGSYARAAEILSFVYHHPFTASLAREEIHGLLNNQWPDYNWDDLLTPAAFTAALERGKTWTLDALADDMLAELSG